MKLSGRKEKILQVVVNNYIDNCQPVSSLEIHDKFFPTVSSATIRNELSALEQMGYLVQPHISAGRIPTAEAYRLYVDRLLPKKKLTRTELKTIKQYFNRKAGAIEELVKNTAKVISQITNLTSVGYVKHQNSDIIQSVNIVKISHDTALFIIVTDRTVFKDATATFDQNLSEVFLKEAGEFMTTLFRGHLVSDAIDSDNFAKQVRREFEKLYSAMIAILKKYGESGLDNITIEGASKLLSQPEYKNAQKAQAMLELLDTKEQLYPLLSSGGMSINIKISGDEERLPDCAIVTASYSVNGTQVGNAGVIGPMRMDYSKVISVLDYVGKLISSNNEEIDENNENNQ